jgi:hypothetical protein
MVFTSSDKLHANIVPIFLRENQLFVLGSELKEDLKKINEYYKSFPNEIKEKGVISFAFYPPKDTSFLTTKLWDRFMSPLWRKNQVSPYPQPETEAIKALKEKIKKMEAAPPVSKEDQENLKETDNMMVERRVRAVKGSWVRFPKEVINRRKNNKGEWEDIS